MSRTRQLMKPYPHCMPEELHVRCLWVILFKMGNLKMLQMHKHVFMAFYIQTQMTLVSQEIPSTYSLRKVRRSSIDGAALNKGASPAGHRAPSARGAEHEAWPCNTSGRVTNRPRYPPCTALYVIMAPRYTHLLRVSIGGFTWTCVSLIVWWCSPL